MIRMYSRRMAEVSITGGTDEVLFGIALPGGSRLNNIKAKMNVIRPGGGIANKLALYYAVEGWILPVHDPDAETLYDTLWNQLVPKDTDVESIDLDTESQDTQPFSEPGEVDWSQLFDVGFRPERVYHNISTLGCEIA